MAKKQNINKHNLISKTVDLLLENPDGSIDFKEINKWQINDMKETRERWAKEDAIKKQQEQNKSQSSSSKSQKM